MDECSGGTERMVYGRPYSYIGVTVTCGGEARFIPGHEGAEHRSEWSGDPSHQMTFKFNKTCMVLGLPARLVPC